MVKFIIRLSWAVVLSCVIVLPVWAQKDVKEAVVKIYTISNRHSYSQPWRMIGQESKTGSGCIIKGKRILTNAHMVGDQTFIQVRRSGEAKKYVAKLEIVAHECDLAILKVDDDSFFSDIEPLEIGELVEVRDKVIVYGFPYGGDKLSVTEGVVSRIEHMQYAHSGAYLLACQIDAAINPGNSGGPVIKNGKIVGVAYQVGEGQNIGYIVPVPVISHFLKDIEDGVYDGIPSLGITVQKMDNPDIRSKFSMTKGQAGILINKVYPDCSAGGVLVPADVILSIEGSDIENDATIEFRKGERTHFSYAAQNKYINNTIDLTILREKKIITVKVKLTKPINFARLVPYRQYDIEPAYYIKGGLVFEQLAENYLDEYGSNTDLGLVPLINCFLFRDPENDHREVVVLAEVLADEINVGYHNLRHNIISYVNDRKISTIRDLVSAFEEYNGKYYTITDEQGYTIVLDKEKTDEISQQILKKYKIDYDRSEDLRGK